MEIDYNCIQSVSGISAGIFKDDSNGERIAFYLEYTRKEGNVQRYYTITKSMEILDVLAKLKRRNLINQSELSRVKKETARPNPTLEFLALEIY